MKLSNELYDKLRFYAMLLGHICTFVLACTEILHFKYGVEIAAVVAAFNVMIGGMLEDSRKKYYAEENNERVGD